MKKMKAPKGGMGQSSRQRAETRKNWYDPVLTLYYGNRRLLTGTGIGVVLVIAGVFGFNYIQAERDAQAQEFLGAIILEYEGGDFRTALDGSGETLGLLDVIDRYQNTPAGNTARFYAGNALFQLNEYDQALEQFENFKAKNDFLGASATAGRAAIHELQGEYSRAANLFSRAAEMDNNLVRSPYYLRSSARCFMDAGEFDAAEGVILEAKDRYPESDLMDELEYMLGLVLAHQ